VAANHVTSERRRNGRLVPLDTIEDIASPDQAPASDNELALQKLVTLVSRLDNPDRTIVTLYLEGLDAAAIGEITGLSPGAIATRISRTKTVLSRLFRETSHG
jgi:RNA polymerase sigma-70 factor (ECF subfamily)